MQDLLNKAAGHQSRDQAECEQSAHNCSPYFGVHVQHCDLTSYWSHSGQSGSQQVIIQLVSASYTENQPLLLLVWTACWGLCQFHLQLDSSSCANIIILITAATHSQVNTSHSRSGTDKRERQIKNRDKILQNFCAWEELTIACE